MAEELAYGLTLRRRRAAKDPKTRRFSELMDSIPYKRLTRAEQATATRDELVLNHMRFAIRECMFFTRINSRHHYELQDLATAAFMGLFEAAERYDPERGAFTTCAKHWIRQSIKNFIRCDNAIPIPYVMKKSSFKGIQMVIESLDSKLHPDDADDVYSSVDTVGSVFTDEAEPVDEKIVREEAESWVHKCLDTLNPHQRHIMRNLYGFDGAPKLMRDIGKELGISAQRVHQIKDVAVQLIKDYAKRSKVNPKELIACLATR